MATKGATRANRRSNSSLVCTRIAGMISGVLLFIRGDFFQTPNVARLARERRPQPQPDDDERALRILGHRSSAQTQYVRVVVEPRHLDCVGVIGRDRADAADLVGRDALAQSRTAEDDPPRASA